MASECQHPSEDVCCILAVVWSLLIKALLPNVAEHRSTNVTELFFWGVVIKVQCRKFPYIITSVKLSFFVLALHVGKQSLKSQLIDMSFCEGRCFFIKLINVFNPVEF